MGWCCDIEGHEGHLVGIVDQHSLFDDGVAIDPALEQYPHERELRYPKDDFDCLVREVRVACECGWRSPKLRAPLGTKWRPWCLTVPSDEAEDVARELWKQHVDNLPDRHCLTKAHFARRVG